MKVKNLQRIVTKWRRGRERKRLLKPMAIRAAIPAEQRESKPGDPAPTI